jgi:hypothetical protein
MGGVRWIIGRRMKLEGGEQAAAGQDHGSKGSKEKKP